MRIFLGEKLIQLFRISFLQSPLSITNGIGNENFVRYTEIIFTHKSINPFSRIRSLYRKFVTLRVVIERGDWNRIQVKIIAMRNKFPRT